MTDTPSAAGTPDAWLVETMLEINRLTPDIQGKAFNPDWFLLRQRFEAREAELSACRAELAERQSELRERNLEIYELQAAKEQSERLLAAAAKDAAQLADAVWGTWSEDTCGGYCCSHCNLVLDSMEGWHKAKHEDSCAVTTALQYSPQAIKQAAIDAVLASKESPK